MTAIAAAVAVAVVAEAPAAADTAATVVLRPSVGRGAGKRHTKRIEKTLHKTLKKRDDVALASSRDTVSAGCATEVVCLANKGNELGAQRVVGISLTRAKKDFTLTFVVAQVQPARELARHEMSTRSRRARAADAPEHLDKALAAADDAGKSEPEQTGDGGDGGDGGDAPSGSALSVAPPAAVLGDGRGVAPIQITGGPSPQAGEMKKRPQVATVECDAAPALPATVDRPPAVLAPATQTARKLQCVARLRGAEAAFSLSVEAPKKPGVYAGHGLPRVRASDGSIALDPFVVSDSGEVSHPTSLRAASSDGRVELAEDGKLVVTLGKKKPPRVVAVVMTDGVHVGAAFVPVWGVTKVDIRAERRSEVSLRIAGRWWGPRVAKRGTVRLPIQVPPGVSSGVVRAVRRDAAVESVANLRVPRLRRLAAVGFSDEVVAGGTARILVALADEVVAGGTARILVALADEDGRPAPDGAAVYGKARRGSVSDAKSLGGGLWEIAYTAPNQPTRDRVDVRVKGDRSAGRARVNLEVVKGAPKMVHVTLPNRTLKPGDEIAGALFVRDVVGNLLEKENVAASLAGEPVELTPSAAGLAFRIRIPERLPADGPLALRVTYGDFTTDRVIPVVLDSPTSATLAVTASRRSGTAVVEARDRFGNLVPTESFTVAATGATTGPLRRVGDRYEMSFEAADDDVRLAAFEVRVRDTVLARESVTLGAGRDAWYVGAWTEGGYVATSGDFAAPRAGVGIGVRRFVGPIELGVGVGVEGFAFEDSPTAMIGGENRELTRSLVGLAIPARVRGRLPVSKRLGVSLDLAVVPTRVQVGLSTDFQSDDDYTEVVVGARGQLAVDWLFGAARARLGVSYGMAELSDGPITGDIEGLGVGLGVEWWFGALGP